MRSIMSKQLTLSAALSVLAMTALALSSAFIAPEHDSKKGDGAATARGSLVQVLVKS